MTEKIKPLQAIRYLSGTIPDSKTAMIDRLAAINLITRAMLGLAEIDFCVDYVKKKTGYEIDFSEQNNNEEF